MKYSGIIIKIETGHISNATGEMVQISFLESSADVISGSNKYTFVELYSKLGDVQGKTLRQLNENAHQFAETNNLGSNFLLHVIK